VPVVYVDPRYTSQGCSACGHVSKKNRPNQATFACMSCGFAEPFSPKCGADDADAVAEHGAPFGRGAWPGRPVDRRIGRLGEGARHWSDANEKT
jgi:hypothetical protein